jgi:hypothetical protein
MKKFYIFSLFLLALVSCGTQDIPETSVMTFEIPETVKTVDNSGAITVG